MRGLIVSLEVNNRLGTVMIFDPSGKTILEISQPDATNPGGLVFQSGTDLSSEPVVQPVLRGDYDALGDKYIGYIGSPPRALAAAGPAPRPGPRARGVPPPTTPPPRASARLTETPPAERGRA